MKKLQISLSVLAIAALMANLGLAQVTMTTGMSAPTYSTTLTFDEPGGPTGNVATDAFASFGIASLNAGDSVPQVNDYTADPIGGPWVGTGNSFFGNFGVFVEFAQDVSEVSVNIWDPAGPPGPIGGGLGVFLFNDGVPINDPFFADPGFFIEPAWGGIGNQALNIEGNGQVFDEVRFVGFGFPATTFMDDLSFNLVPEPSGILLLCSGLLLLRRRR